MIRIISSMTCYEILIYYVKENLDVELSLIDVRERGENGIGTHPNQIVISNSR